MMGLPLAFAQPLVLVGEAAHEAEVELTDPRRAAREGEEIEPGSARRILAPPPRIDRRDVG